MVEVTRSIPMLPVNHWWALRKRFKQSIPGIVTDNYLSTVLDMQIKSARANVLPFLKSLGIIDDDGKPKERARQWRDDARYPEVCQAILKEVYPDDLLQAVPGPKIDRSLAERWFANFTGAGQAACQRMAGLYAVLVEADPSGPPEREKASGSKRAAKRPTAPQPSGRTTRMRSFAKEAPAPEVAQAAPAPAVTPNAVQPTGPGININLQVHISADASPDQIEQIFAAMAKHIYRTE